MAAPISFNLEDRINDIVIPRYRLYKKVNGDLILQKSYNGKIWVDIETVKESEE